MKKVFLGFILAILLIFGCRQKNDENSPTEMAESTTAPISAISTGITTDMPTTPPAPEESGKSSVITDSVERIKNGDFSDVKWWHDDKFIKIDYVEILSLLEIKYNIINDELEWVERDINGDGKNELVWREKDLMKRTSAIFTFMNEEVYLVFVDGGGAHFYTFLSDFGYDVHYQFWYSITGSDSFLFYKLNHDFSAEFIYGVTMLRVYDFSEVKDEWLDSNPHIKENGPGVYCQEFYLDPSFHREDVEYTFISEEQFLKTVKEMAGFDFYDVMIW